MTDSTPDDRSSESSTGRRTWRVVLLPKVDFVAVILALLVVVIVLFLTAEMWLPHFPG